MRRFYQIPVFAIAFIIFFQLSAIAQPSYQVLGGTAATTRTIKYFDANESLDAYEVWVRRGDGVAFDASYTSHQAADLSLTKSLSMAGSAEDVYFDPNNDLHAIFLTDGVVSVTRFAAWQHMGDYKFSEGKLDEYSEKASSSQCLFVVELIAQESFPPQEETKIRRLHCILYNYLSKSPDGSEAIQTSFVVHEAVGSGSLMIRSSSDGKEVFVVSQRYDSGINLTKYAIDDRSARQVAQWHQEYKEGTSLTDIALVESDKKLYASFLVNHNFEGTPFISIIMAFDENLQPTRTPIGRLDGWVSSIAASDHFIFALRAGNYIGQYNKFFDKLTLQGWDRKSGKPLFAKPPVWKGVENPFEVGTDRLLIALKERRLFMLLDGSILSFNLEGYIRPRRGGDTKNPIRTTP